MPLRRSLGGLSRTGNLFDRPGFYDTASIEALTVEATLLMKAVTETYGVTLTHAEQTGNYNLEVPVMSANDQLVTTTATQTLSNKTFVITTIMDANNNEQLDLTPVANAVNYLEITNSATNNPPILKASGDNNNIDLRLEPKGTGKVVIDGDFDVQGTQTTINSTTLDVDDKNITMGSVDNPTDGGADGGGLTLKGATDKTIIWDNANDNWTSNQDWNLPTGKVFKINNVSKLSNDTLGATVLNSSLTSTGVLAGGSIDDTFGNIDIGTSVVTAGQLNIDQIRIDGNTISSTSGQLILDAATSLNLSDDSALAIGNMTLDAIYGAADAIAIGDNSNDAVSIYRVTALTAIGDLDIGTHDFKAATLTADTLVAGRVVYTGTGGVLAAESSLAYNTSTNVLSTPTLEATNINAFALQGKLTAGSTEIEGNAFDINGGNIDNTTLGADAAVTVSGGDISADLTWSVAQTGIDINSGTLNGITALGIVESGGGSEMQIAVTQNLTADRTLTFNINNAARTLNTSGDLIFGNAFTTGNYALTLTTTAATNVTLPTSGTLATLANSETLSAKSISMATNTITGTTAQFNTALTDNNFATIAGSETLTSKTLTTPTIGSFTNATHDHTDAAGGGTLAIANTTGTLAVARGGTGATTLNDLITLGTHSTGNYVATIAGTANEIEVTGSGSETAGVTIGLPDNVTITGDLTVNGTYTTVNSTVVTIDDPIFQIGGDAAPTTDDNKDRGIAFRWHNGTTAKNGFFGYDDNTGKFTFIPDATLTNEVVSGTAGTIVATTFEGNATTATTATNVTSTANNSTNETVYPTFVDGQSGAQGIETDSGLTYNPNTGVLTASGGFSGVVTGTAESATSLANPRTIGMTGDVSWTSASFDGTANVTGTSTIGATKVLGSMLNITAVTGHPEITSASGIDTTEDMVMVWDEDANALKSVKLANLGISGTAVGSSNEIQYNNSNSFAGAANVEIKNASLALKEMAAPNNVTGYGLLYAKSDNELYFKDDGGNETKITNGGSLAGGGAFKGIKAYLNANLSIANAASVTLGSGSYGSWTESYDV